MSSSRIGCVYCGLPRARVRNELGYWRELPACPSHVEVLVRDEFYFGPTAGTPVALDELLLSLAAGSAIPHPPPSPPLPMPP